MAAIREKQQEMAEFLIDNGIDKDFETTRLVSTCTDKCKYFTEDVVYENEY